MADGSVTDEQAHRWLQEIAMGDPIITTGKVTGYTGSWVSLHHDNPALAGVDRAEVSGGGYQRFKMAWNMPNNRTIWSLVDARYNGMMQTKVTYFGVWNLQNQGFLRAYAELSEPAVVLQGKGFILHAGTVAISFG
jgi:hypothetical protein